MKSNRRRFLTGIGTAGLATAFFKTPGAFAQALVETPQQTEGPYYPPTLPLDTDNDLLMINDTITPAVGTISYLSGRILDQAGNPVPDARVEIWHADNSGAYIHPQSNGYANRDRNFQGFGRFVTGSSGEYLFRTIRAGLYTGRTRHIHMKIRIAGRADFTTQVYYAGEPGNAADNVLGQIASPQARAAVIVPWNPVPNSTVGAIAARFDVIMGVTPASALTLRLANATNTARFPAFAVGDSWRLDLAGGPAASRVWLRFVRDGADLGTSGPYGGLIDANGAWSLSGSFGSSERGNWRIAAVVAAVGGPAGGAGGPGAPGGPSPGPAGGGGVTSVPVDFSVQ